LEQYVLFGVNHEECQRESERMKPLEIDLASILHIEGPGLYHNFAEDVVVPHLANSNANENDEIATRVEPCVHHHRAFVHADPSPFE
jgi:hypothetical protein